MIIYPSLRTGTVSVPPSKSHAHRLLISNFLADGGGEDLREESSDAVDILATKRSLKALRGENAAPELDVGESGSTLRFLAPIAAALGKSASFKTAGRLSQRPFVEYATLQSGLHELKGDVSSQFVTGLMFALPLIKGDSQIKFTTPLESRGYVDMTVDVIRKAGVEIEENQEGFFIPGSQRYHRQFSAVEGDWSGGAFWYAMNALGCKIKVEGLSHDSLQPDLAISRLLPKLPDVVDVSQFPDIFPVLTVVAASLDRKTTFTGIKRLRLKESDRVAAMVKVLGLFGAETQAAEDSFTVTGTGRGFKGGSFPSYNDHRIAMSIAAGSVIADSPVEIENAESVAKSYPNFFEVFNALAKL